MKNKHPTNTEKEEYKMPEQQAEKLYRPRVQALDDMLGKTHPVLDDGFIRVIDYMGDEASIIQAARVSYGQGTRSVTDDTGLIRYLLRHRHTTPFEMNELKLHLRVPMDAWRQWIRHRTASVNEYSTRYSVAIGTQQTTQPDAWREQSTSNKQGSQGTLPIEQGQILSQKEQELHRLVQEEYQTRIDLGVAREQARKDLPLSTYTEAYWKIDLHNLLHFLGLRMESHAQKEIREYATIIGENIVSTWVPNVWQAFKDYRFEAMTLSAPEQRAIQLISTQGYNPEDPQLYVLAGIVKPEHAHKKQHREREEAKNKILHLLRQNKDE